jgi:hypothetical protein
MLRGLSAFTPSPSSVWTAWQRAARGTTTGIVLAFSHQLLNTRILPPLFNFLFFPRSASSSSSFGSFKEILKSAFFSCWRPVKSALDWLGFRILTREEYEQLLRQKLEELEREERYKKLREAVLNKRTITSSPSSSSSSSSSSNSNNSNNNNNNNNNNDTPIVMTTSSAQPYNPQK